MSVSSAMAARVFARGVIGVGMDIWNMDSAPFLQRELMRDRVHYAYPDEMDVA